MRPEIGIESVAYLLRDVRRVVFHAETLKKVADDSGGQRAETHDDKKLQQLRKETLSRDTWA